jgi:redox-sensitive bicupin YhaK (pirin superfamily)
VVAGQPIREPIVRYGPFAMTAREEIIEAIRDFQASRF